MCALQTQKQTAEYTVTEGVLLHNMSFWLRTIATMFFTSLITSRGMHIAKAPVNCEAAQLSSCSLLDYRLVCAGHNLRPQHPVCVGLSWAGLPVDVRDQHV